MDIKEMRERLRDVVETVPRSNTAVIALFNEKFPAEANEPEETVKIVQTEDNIYTYVGKGHTPPQVIKFMGKQVFKRGEATKVTDPLVLNKVKQHPCFIKGEVSGEMIIRQDDMAEEIAQKQITENERIQFNAVRMMGLGRA